ncbi:MAG: hypothetical protein J6W02_03115 [Bacteroidaceae bacterium]|nr:hypothetical protein [Bacteroidaceae bacterium]MBO7557905.1 hypothetical protein [Bacteroidaceae bacterium]
MKKWDENGEYPKRFSNFARQTKNDMATYTITLNERTTSGKALIAYLKALGVLMHKVSPKAKSSYLRSQEDKMAGRIEKFSSSEEMFKSLGI